MLVLNGYLVQFVLLIGDDSDTTTLKLRIIHVKLKDFFCFFTVCVHTQFDSLWQPSALLTESLKKTWSADL